MSPINEQSIVITEHPQEQYKYYLPIDKVHNRFVFTRIDTIVQSHAIGGDSLLYFMATSGNGWVLAYTISSIITESFIWGRFNNATIVFPIAQINSQFVQTRLQVRTDDSPWIYCDRMPTSVYCISYIL